VQWLVFASFIGAIIEDQIQNQSQRMLDDFDDALDPIINASNDVDFVPSVLQRTSVFLATPTKLSFGALLTVKFSHQENDRVTRYCK
jgi:hypothetical protein